VLIYGHLSRLYNERRKSSLRIVVLDGYTLNPGDLSWEPLKQLGETAIYDRTPEDKILERAKDAEIVITNKTPLFRETIDQLPNMKYIGVLATGYNVVDVEYAAMKGIPVTNVPTYGTNSVAQMVFALLLELCNRVKEHSDAVKDGEWSRNTDFCFWKYPLVELAGKTMGIIGFGRIGRQTARIADAMSMNIIAFDKFRGEDPVLTNFRWADTIEELLAESDVVSLHCPLLPDTKGIINKNTLKMMKKTAFLINTSRGPLVVDEDLAETLNNGCIAGAALDVLSVEPPPPDNPLLKAANIIITPHISWATKEARSRLMDIAVENVRAFINGELINVVNGVKK